MLTELFVALAFTAAALAGAMSWPVWIAVALGAHGLWDWAHHRERVPTPCHAGMCRSAPFSTGSMRRGFRYLVEGRCSAAWINAVSGELRPSSATLMASTAVIFSRLGVGS